MFHVVLAGMSAYEKNTTKGKLVGGKFESIKLKACLTEFGAEALAA